MCPYLGEIGLPVAEHFLVADHRPLNFILLILPLSGVAVSVSLILEIVPGLRLTLFDLVAIVSIVVDNNRKFYCFITVIQNVES